MKKLSLGLATLISTSATVFAHGYHGGQAADGLSHGSHGISSVVILTATGVAAVVLVKVLLSRAGR